MLKQIINILIYLIVGSLIYFYLYDHFYYNPTKSLAVGHYFTYKNSHYIHNDIVLFCLDTNKHLQYLKDLELLHLPYISDNAIPIKNICNNEFTYLLKHIVASSGDIVEIKQSRVFINNKIVAHSLIKKIVVHNNKTINLHSNNILKVRLKSNQYFVMGNSDDSYDSRYFGIIDNTNIYRKAIYMFHVKP